MVSGEEITLEMEGFSDIKNITNEVDGIADRSKIKDYKKFTF